MNDYEKQYRLMKEMYLIEKFQDSGLTPEIVLEFVTELKEMVQAWLPESADAEIAEVLEEDYQLKKEELRIELEGSYLGDDC